MQNDDKKLWRKLVIVIAIKLVIILTIWWVFMRPNTTSVDEEGVQEHLLSVISLPVTWAYNDV